MDIGVARAGFDVRLCVEIDEACCETLRHNLPNTKVMCGDVSQMTGTQLLAEAGVEFGELDLLFGGPPCQSFSLAGNRKGLNDDRGKLVFDFVRLVKQSLPKTFIMENVSAMGNWEHGKVLKEIESMFSSEYTFGARTVRYNVDHRVLDAKDFGVPQSRKRIFVCGNLLERDVIFPQKSHGPNLIPYNSVGDAICHLPPADQPSRTALRVSQTIKSRIKSHGY